MARKGRAPAGPAGPGAPGAVDDARWGALAAEVFVGIKAWRQQHPRATFVALERALDERWAAVRARLLQDLALASAAATRPARPAASRPGCPTCGGALARRGTGTRRVGVTHGQTVELARAYAVCTACGGGLFPPG
jgi:YgiT-type zinc finger domain-containing protein